MRVIGGRSRGRRLAAKLPRTVRPTSDRVRESIFDILGSQGGVEGLRTVDLFCGSGALGLEALSRGAARATFIERDPAALAALRANIATCGAEARCRVIPGDALHPPAGDPAGLAFLDPPYAEGLSADAVAALRGRSWFGPGTILILETARADALPDPGGELLAERSHGVGRITVWRC